MKGREIRKWLKVVAVYLLSASMLVQPLSAAVYANEVEMSTEMVPEDATEEVSGNAFVAESDEVTVSTEEVSEKNSEMEEVSKSDEEEMQESEEVQAEVEADEEELIAETAVNKDGFDIDENGVLLAYTGTNTDIKIPDGVKKIADGVFKDIKVTSVTLPKGLESVGKDCFNVEPGTKVYLPSGWEGICEFDKYAFISPYYDQYGMSFVVPTNVENVGQIPQVITKVIIQRTRGDYGYQEKDWYKNVTAKIPAFEENDFDEDGYVINNGELLAYDGPGGDLVIPSTVTKIAKNVFMGMDIFDSITISDSVTEIGTYSFANLRNRCKKIVIGDGLKEIPISAFSVANSCEEVVIGNSVEKIGYQAFWGCHADKFVLPESVKELEEHCFAFCDHVDSINFENVEVFGTSLFYTSGRGAKIDVLDLSSAKVIKERAFDEVKANQIKFGKNIESIENQAIRIEDGGLLYLDPEWDDSCEIAPNMFYGSSYGTGLVIPSGVTNVNDAFFNKNAISFIVAGTKDGSKSYLETQWYQKALEAGITVIEKEDEKLDTIDQLYDEDGFLIEDGVLIGYNGPGGDLVIPDTVTKIAKGAFSRKDIFTSITIPDSVVEMEPYCFYYLKENLKKVVIGNGLKAIPDYAFSSAYNLEEFIIGENVESIGVYALQSSGLHELVLPPSVKRLEKYSLYNNKLDSIDLSHVEYIGESIWSYSHKIEMPVLDLSSLKECGGGDTFKDIHCQKVIFPEDFENLPSMNINWNRDVKAVIWPKNVKNINSHAFYNSDFLTDYPLPDSVTTIGSYAFGGKYSSNGEYSYCNEFTLPFLLTSVENYGVALADDANIILPHGWNGSCEFQKNALLNSEEPTMTVTIPTDIKDIEDYFIDHEHVGKFVIVKQLNGSEAYKETDWYKKLVESGIPIQEKVDEGIAGVSINREKGSNVFVATYEQEVALEADTTVVCIIPDGYTFDSDSVDSQFAKNVKVEDQQVTFTVLKDTTGTLQVSFLQNKLLDEKQSVEMNVTIGDEVHLHTLDLAVYGTLAPHPSLKNVCVDVVGNPYENVVVHINDKAYDCKLNGLGQSYFSELATQDENDVYITIGGLDSEHQTVVVNIEEFKNLEVSNLTVANIEWHATKETVTDITESGKIVTVYPANIFTFEMKGSGFDPFITSSSLLSLRNGNKVFPIKKVGECYIAQGYLGSPNQLVEIMIEDEVLFSTTVKWIIDPSGYVYEAYPDNRVEGATVTIYYSESPFGENAVKWDAENYRQENDLLSTSSGSYAWDVPEGYYQVVAKKDGYVSAKSAWLPVPPVQTDINLALVDKSEPNITMVEMTEDSLTICFDKYMEYDYYLQTEGYYSLKSAKENIAIKSVSALSDSEEITKAVKLEFEQPLTEQQKQEVYTLESTAYQLVSYAGTPLKEKKVTDIRVKDAIDEIVLDKGAGVCVGNKITVTAQIIPAESAENVEVVATLSDESKAKILGEPIVAADGTVKVDVEGITFGETTLTLAIKDRLIAASMPIIVAVSEEVIQETVSSLGIENQPEQSETGSEAVTSTEPSPSTDPSTEPSTQPSETPEVSPSTVPSEEPSEEPSTEPSTQPSDSPEVSPSTVPSETPSTEPSTSPSAQPSEEVSTSPVASPSPSEEIWIDPPYVAPSVKPSVLPSTQPSEEVSVSPSAQPSEEVSTSPSAKPSEEVSTSPSHAPGTDVTTDPAKTPEVSVSPSVNPSVAPSESVSVTPSTMPSILPSAQVTTSAKPESTFVPKKIDITSISKKLAAGKKMTLTLNILPVFEEDLNVKWVSSNPKYASIDENGVVKANKAGVGKTVTITATVNGSDKVKGYYKIKIMKDSVKSVKLSAKSKSVEAGKSISIKATVKTTGKKVNKKLVWSVSNEKYASISQSGKLKTTKKAKGKTITVTAKSTDGSNKIAKIKIKVK